MSRTVAMVVLVGMTLLVAPAAAAPHHGAATFDTSQEITLEGVVTDWVWFNPHCFLKFEVENEDGTTTVWAVEAGNPTDMTQRGWSRRSFEAGDQVTVTLQPARSGSPVGRVRSVVLADGRKFQ